GGRLSDYVPFYFDPLSPMLYAIHRGVVAGFNGDQRSIIHLVSTVQAIKNEQLPFIFTDGHASMAYTKFYDRLSNLSQVDWSIFTQKHWMNTLDDQDRKRRRQAELLVHNFFPWTLFGEI